MGRTSNNNEDKDIYELYLKDIQKYEMLDNVKSRKLLYVYKNGTQKERKKAKDVLIGGHQRFVISIAKKFSRGNNIMDVVAEGNIGLLRAIEEYDLKSDAKFTTYATFWVRKAIIQYININEPLVIPNNAIKIATYVPKVKNKFWNKNCRQPTTEEIQEILMNDYNISIPNKEDLFGYVKSSIDEKYERDEDGQEFMESNTYTSATAECDTDSFTKGYDEKSVVERILSNFNERDTYIIKCIYGIGCCPKTMDDIADELGLSYERVRQIVTRNVSNMSKKGKKLIGTFEM